MAVRYRLISTQEPSHPDVSASGIAVFCALGRHATAASVAEAAAAGARVVLCEPALFGVVPRMPGVRVLAVHDVRRAYARLAQIERGRPASKLAAVAVTGTNGKSTVAHWLTWVLRRLGEPTGLIGTVSVETGQAVHHAGLTTPDARDLARFMADMRDAGLTHVVMEASSHGLDQRRTDGIPFRVAVFTNFSPDHLDYHPSLTAYFDAKRRLFSDLRPSSAAVLNVDDPRWRDLARSTSARVIGYGHGAPAVVRGRWVGGRADVRYGSWSALSTLGGLGEHRLSNALAVLAAAVALGHHPERVWCAIRAYPGLWRRLEVISAPDDPVRVIDDCSHNPANLAAALNAAAGLGDGAIHVLYAIRGARGPAVNALNAHVLACFSRDRARIHLIVRT